MKRPTTSLIISLCLFTTLASAQTNLSGTVVDTKGETLIGVTVRIKDNTALGTITDEDGKYSLNVPSSSGTLIFSYVGYRPTEVNFSEGKTTYNITMKSELELNEVVVIGYGTQKKSDITGAISSLKGKDIEGLPNAN